MENIIKKAIDGGYGSHVNMEFASNYYHVCDPLFWQALGKACEWTQAMWIDTYPSRMFGFLHKRKLVDGKYENTERWQHEAMTFHEINLTEGWDKAVEYLKNLIK